MTNEIGENGETVQVSEKPQYLGLAILFVQSRNL